MHIKKNTREVYEEPIVEVITFSIGDNIALSTNFGPGTTCTEETH